MPYGFRYDGVRRLHHRGFRDVRPGRHGRTLPDSLCHDGVRCLVDRCLCQVQARRARPALAHRLADDGVRRLVLRGLRDLPGFRRGRPFNLLRDPVGLHGDLRPVRLDVVGVPVRVVADDLAGFAQDLYLAVQDLQLGLCDVLRHAVAGQQPHRSGPYVGFRAAQVAPCVILQLVPCVVPDVVPGAAAQRFRPVVARVDFVFRRRVRRLHEVGAFHVHRAHRRGDRPALHLQLAGELRHLPAELADLRLVRLQRDRVGVLGDLRLQARADLAVIQQLPPVAGPHVHLVLAQHLVPRHRGQVLPAVRGNIVPAVRVVRLDPYVAGDQPAVARFRFGIVERAVSQACDPGVDGVDGLGNRAAAYPVAHRAPDVGVARQVRRVDHRDRRFPGKQLVHVDQVRRQLVHQGVAGVDVHRVQVRRDDVRAQVDCPAVRRVPVLDLLRRRMDLRRRYVAAQVYVELIEVIV